MHMNITAHADSTQRDDMHSYITYSIKMKKRVGYFVAVVEALILFAQLPPVVRPPQLWAAAGPAKNEKIEYLGWAGTAQAIALQLAGSLGRRRHQQGR